MGRLVRVLGVLIALSVFAPFGVVSAAAPTGETQFRQALEAFQQGAVEEAAERWAAAARAYEREGNPSEQISALTALSVAYVSLGQYRKAVQTLEAAADRANRLRDRARLARALAALGDVYVALGPSETAESYLKRSLAIAREAGNTSLTAAGLNNLGNLLATERKYEEAITVYRESIALADQGGDAALAVRALSNAAAALRKHGDAREANRLLDRAWDHVRPLPPSHETTAALINIGVGYRDLRLALPEDAGSLLRRAGDALNEGGRLAASLGDHRSASYAWGYLGGLYEDERRYPEALQLTRKAVFAAQQVGAPESLYRWEWQAGRLLKRLGSLDESVAAYRRAVRTLQSIRPELAATYGTPQASFRESVGPVYFELVDLLLQRAASLPSRDQILPYLVEARESVELFKAAELRDYFRDDCVDLALSKATKLDAVSQTTVVIYPIILPDRLELLVSLPTGLKRVSVPVGAERLTREVRAFRRKLEKRTTREYFPHARQLYEWLIRPLDGDLSSMRVDTLVFVPDGPLRTIPMAALHDGEQFLVSKYALGITPGLNLTDPRPLNRTNEKVLAVGVTEAVQGFAALPNVSAELAAVRAIFPGSTSLVDQQFSAANLEQALKGEEYTIVHIASHGQFGDNVQDTFVLAFDEKMTMNRLDELVGVFKFRDEPLELLTLSACDTAAGDDRAALGLAGVAIKAGARSALATLWNINDQASVVLVADFYRALQDPSVSRAVALQRAQTKLLADPRYEHPGFWSPFLLLNTWL